MGRPIGAGDTMFVHNGAENLAGFQDHFNTMFVGMVLSGQLGVEVQHKYVHII